MSTTRKHGEQLVDEDDAFGPNGDALMEAASKAMDTPLVRACYAALEVVAAQHGVVRCDDFDGECQFPRCLAAGCEGEPADESGPTRRGEPA
jgi:hypothetical protein